MFAKVKLSGLLFLELHKVSRPKVLRCYRMAPRLTVNYFQAWSSKASLCKQALTKEKMPSSFGSRQLRISDINAGKRKKIEDVPEERRHRLLTLLKPRLISRAWEIAGTRYDDAKLANKSASSLLSNQNGTNSLEMWNCRTSRGPFPISWIKFFEKAIFRSKDGNTYGRLIGGSLLAGIFSSYSPLYFTVREVNEVLSTEQPCDLSYEFGDGLLNLPEYPQGFPKPAKHPWPFNDQVVIYVRHVGPGVLVAQAWQEGESLQQVPKKLCGEILMVKT